VFLHRGTSISWKSLKHTLVATSTNHSEIIALYETLRECVWLRRMMDHIQVSCGIGAIESSTIIYEDNVACVNQLQTRYVKTNYTKHISLKLFFIHINHKKVERLVSYKLNHAIIILIYLQSLYL
jgi:predicted lipoprotein